jgi:4-amino-4-deoxy-L-arabinose transferase-like glycosyltransferase
MNLNALNEFFCRLWRYAMKPNAPAWLFPLTAIWLSFMAWLRPLHIPDEGRYVGVAWDMVRFDSTWTPLLNGLPYFHKPPLFYWLTEYSFLLFGAHEWAARLPSLVVAFLTAICLYFFVRRHRGVEVATATLLALVTMPYFYGAAQYANLDMLVGGMITLTILAGAEAVSRQKAGQSHKGFAVAMGALAALAILSKGLIGIALPGGVLFFWLLVTRRWQGFAVLLAPGVWLAVLLVGLPWFIAMEWQYSGFLHYFFVYQHFERFLTSGFNQQQAWWFFIPVLLGFTLPWSLALLEYLRPSVRAAMRFVGYGQWFALLLIWVVLITVFFSIPASKLIGYTVPVIPPLAILMAEALVAGLNGLRRDKVFKQTLTFFIAGAITCVIALTIFLFVQKDSTKPFAELIQSEQTSQDGFIFIDIYPFDSAFYTGSQAPAWVVTGWKTLAKGDNWRHELADAGDFKPELGADILVDKDDLIPRMCQALNRTYWVRIQDYDVARWPFIAKAVPKYEARDGGRWFKVNVDETFRGEWCPKLSHAGKKVLG